METKINLHFKDIVIPATLNGSTAAREFLSRLPCVIHASMSLTSAATWAARCPASRRNL